MERVQKPQSKSASSLRWKISEKAKPFNIETFEQKIVDIADNGVREEVGGN